MKEPKDFKFSPPLRKISFPMSEMYTVNEDVIKPMKRPKFAGVGANNYYSFQLVFFPVGLKVLCGVDEGQGYYVAKVGKEFGFFRGWFRVYRKDNFLFIKPPEQERSWWLVNYGDKSQWHENVKVSSEIKGLDGVLNPDKLKYGS